MPRKALIVYGGWDGHQPKEVAQVFDRVLKEDGFETEMAETLDAFKDESKLMGRAGARIAARDWFRFAELSRG